jgi:hypothetical protein
LEIRAEKDWRWRRVGKAYIYPVQISKWIERRKSIYNKGEEDCYIFRLILNCCQKAAFEGAETSWDLDMKEKFRTQLNGPT